MTNTLSTPSSVIPGMWYRDAPAAIDWLCRVFGFEKHVVVPGPDGTILHAELTLGGGMLMLGSIREGGQRRLIAQPDEIGGVETRGLNLIVADADAVYAQAKAAGAEIVQDIEDKPYGGRGFTCLDLERRLWHVSTYNPWQSKP
jgi:uncharacterized glyoxalase superfamily protein PhnB